MSDKRRAEILAKRAKLEEMRKAKAQRQAEADRRTSLVRPAALPFTLGWIPNFTFQGKNTATES
jgi:hypothetical protein